MGAVVGVKYRGNVGGDFAFEVLFGDVLLGVLLEVELAALPGGGGEAGSEGGSQAGVGVGGDEVGNSQAALAQAVGKFTPVDFSFAQGAGYAEDHSFSVFAAHADGDQGGAISDGAVDADFVVGGVEGEVDDRWKGKRIYRSERKMGTDIIYCENIAICVSS